MRVAVRGSGHWGGSELVGRADADIGSGRRHSLPRSVLRRDWLGGSREQSSNHANAYHTHQGEPGNRLLKFTVSNYFTTAFRCQYLLGQSGHVDTSAILDAGWVALGASGLNKTPD